MTVSLNHPMATTGGSSGGAVSAHITNPVVVLGEVTILNNPVTAHVVNQVSAHVANQVSAYITGTVGVTGNTSAHVINTVSAHVVNTASVTPFLVQVLKSTAGTTVSGNNEPVSRVAAKKIKVHGFSLTTRGVSATICKFLDGTAGTSKWQVVLETTSGQISGANLAVTPPGYLFETSVSAALVLNTDSGSVVHYSVAWFEEA